MNEFCKYIYFTHFSQNDFYNIKHLFDELNKGFNKEHDRLECFDCNIVEFIKKYKKF